MDCAQCKQKECYQGKDCLGIKQELIPDYQTEFPAAVMKIVSCLEAKHYMQLTRLEELIKFCEQMDFKHLGVAFCVGLASEAKTFSRILEGSFKVSSVCCKVCGIDKKEFNLSQIKPRRYEAVCNPIGQARILNEAKTDLNIIFGLCIGHDVLFSEHSHTPVTTFAVKDRVLAHNPLGAVYSGYYKRSFLKESKGKKK